jgi:S1-C subfamily serine protease
MQFRDVSEHRWSAEYIKWMTDMGVLEGYPDGTFRPEQPVTREQAAAMLRRYSFALNLWNRGELPELLKSVVTIAATFPDGKSGQGTGFFISPTVIATNEHVVKQATSLTFYGALGTVKPRLKALTDIQDLQDLALLESPVPSPVWLKLREKDVYQGMHVGVLGTPIGYPNNFSQGVISHTNRESWTGRLDWFQTDAAINPGNSGGPVIDGRGHVCGVAVAKVAASGIEGVAFGIKVDRLRRFAEKLGGVEF